MAGGRWPPKESDSPRGSPNSKGVINVTFKGCSRCVFKFSFRSGPPAEYGDTARQR